MRGSKPTSVLYLDRQILGFNVWIEIDLFFSVGIEIDFGFVSGPKITCF